MQKHYKKLAVIIPLTGMLSMSAVAPVTSFAAETQKADVSSQEGLVQGYLMENGKMTPVYKNKLTKFDTAGDIEPDLPQLSPNPYDPVPDHGTVYGESANIGNVIYFRSVPNTANGGYVGATHHVFLPIDAQKYPNIGYFIEKQPDGTIRDGYYNPEDLSLIVDSNDAVSHVSLGLDEVYGAIWDGTTKVKRETRYQLVKPALLDNAGVFNFNETRTSGIATANMFGMAATIGWKIGLKAGIPGIVDVSSEISGSLTASYQHTVTVTKQVSELVGFSIGRVDNPDYQYNDYAAAVYQIQSDYTMEPGKGLSSVIGQDSDLKSDSKSWYWRTAALADTDYLYQGAKYYFAATPGSHKKSQ